VEQKPLSAGSRADMKKVKENKAQLEKAYFDEVHSWDSNIVIEANKSKKIAWIIASICIVITSLSVFAVAMLAPLKTVEPFVIRVNDSNGMVDVISVLAETDGVIKQSSQELLDKYWLGKYILGREGYHFETRNLDRRQTALLSSIGVQQEYAELTDPKKNKSAPISLYGVNASVEIKIKAISFINRGEIMNKEKRYTALIRYTTRVKRQGSQLPLVHWVATATFAYRNTPMKVNDRLINPLGFQIVNYRNDQENGASK